MSHDHCDCVEGLKEHVAWLRGRLAEQDARGLRLAGKVERLWGAAMAVVTGSDVPHILSGREPTVNRDDLRRLREEVIAEDISP